MSTQATRFGSCPFRRPLQAAVLLLLLALLPATVSAQLTTEPSVAFSYTTRSGVRRAQIRRAQIRRAQIRRVFVVRGRRSVRVIWVLREFPAFRVGDGFTVTQTSSIVGDNLVWSCDVTYVNPRAPGQPRSFLMSINHGQSTNVVRTGDVVLTEGVARHFSGSIRVRQGYSPPLRRGVYSPLWREGSLTLRIDGRRESRGTFTGTWTWSSANPDPVVTPHPPVSPCSNRGSFGGGGGCGNDSRFQNICAPNPKLETYGWRTHYSAASQSSSGCSSCGGSAPGTSGSDNLLNLSHTFIPSNQASIGSSSPGVYYNFDQRIEFYDAGGDQIATLFDPISRRVYYYEYKPSESAYVSLIDVDGSAQESDAAFKLLELEDSAGNPVTHPSTIATQTVYAVVTSREGWTYKSELVDIDPGTGVAPVSRLTEVTSPTGKVQTLTYKYNQGDPALSGAPKKILQIDTISDWQGNTASFTYDSSQQAGRWVVSDIDIVAQGHAGTVNRSLRYTYNSNGHLHQVFRDVSGTEAAVGTYTYGTDSVWQAATINMDEHFGAVPREEKLFVSQDYRTWKNGLVNQFSNALIGAADGAGTRNLIVFRDIDNPGRYRVLENNQLTEWDAGVSVIACSSYATGAGPGYNSFTNVQYETNHPEYLDANGNPPTTEQVLLGRPGKVKDGTIRSAVSPSYDSDGNVSRIDYADTSYELWQYDADNQETYYRNRDGIVTLTQRNNDGQIVRVVRGLVDVSGPGSEIADTNTTPVQDIRGYNSNGQLEWEATNAYVAGTITAPAANVRTDYVYKTNKQLEKVLRPLAPGQSSRPETQYQWAGEQLVSMTVVRDSTNETTTYAYDSRNRLIKTTYPDSTTEEVAYTTNGLTTYRKDRSNIVSSVTRDSVGRVASRSSPLAYDTDLTNVDINGTPATIFERLSDQVSTTSYTYTPGESRPDEVVTDGRTTKYTYDYKDRLTETLQFTGHRGGVEQAQATRTEYKSNMQFNQESIFGTVSSGTFTPAYTRKTYFGYAADGTTVRTVQVASASTTTYADNAAVMNASRPSSTAANPSILITDAIRDLSGNVVSLINSLNTTQLTAYDTLGRSLSQKPDSVNFSNLVSTSEYDVWNNITKSTDPAGVETTRQYDASGQYLSSQIHGANASSLSMKTEFTYNRSGRRKSVIAPGTNGLPDSNRTTTTFYDAACCGQTVGTYDYDVLGRRTELELHAINSGTPQKTTYGFDSAGRIELATLHSGAKRKISRDFSGVVDKVEYFPPSSSTASSTDDFTYNGFLQRTASSNIADGVTHAYTYTDRGQLDTDTTNYSSQNYVVDYGYDSRGRLDKITYPSGRVADYTLTNRGELDTVDWNGTEIENRAYDALGRMTSVDRAYVDETRVYDNANRATSIANTNLGTATYTYDANSNKLGETWTGNFSTWSFTTEDSGASDPDGYDDEDRFVRFEQSSQSKDYDLVRSDIGNITDRKLNGTSQLRTFNEVHQLTDLASTAQIFDANGSLTTSHTGMTLSWQEGNGRLDQTVVPSGATAGIEGTNDYGYDAENKRLWKKITRSGSVAEHTVYIYAGPNCIAEYGSGSAATAPEQEYIYGQSIDSLLMIAHDNNAERLTVLRNQQWSVSGLMKASDGTIAELYSYDAFGKRTILAANGTTVRTSSNYNNPYGYTSRRHDEESGLMYYRARYYDPEMGEFCSQDPLEMVDGASMYRGYFVLAAMDPSGLECVPKLKTQKHKWIKKTSKISTRFFNQRHTYLHAGKLEANDRGGLLQVRVKAEVIDYHGFPYSDPKTETELAETNVSCKIICTQGVDGNCHAAASCTSEENANRSNPDSVKINDQNLWYRSVHTTAIDWEVRDGGPLVTVAWNGQMNSAPVNPGIEVGITGFTIIPSNDGWFEQESTALRTDSVWECKCKEE